MTTKGNDYAIGIDLGTTYSCVAIMKNDKVEIIPNDQGGRTTPSYVAFTDNERLIGDAAKNQAALNPENTVYDIKRLIGRKYTDPTVQNDIRLWSFKVNEGKDERPRVNVNYLGEEKNFKAEEISAMVLVKMKEIAEAYLGEDIKKAVITVPAYFNDTQRAATKDAGTIAGLDVLRVINEPTAASISYGMDKMRDEEKTILIFDMGGGTHDVTLLSLDGGIFEVKATSGNAHLGGEDMDNRLVNHFTTEFKRKHKKDMTTNKRALRRLRTACERAKRTLSAATQASVEIDSLYDGLDLYSVITRARFEELCSDLFRDALKPVENVLSDAKLDKSQIDEIVLVGGSTRIPKIQKMLSDLFSGKELNKSINPDEAVAYGAAVQAFILNGGKNASTDQMLLLDVCPLSIGIETAGGIMSTLVKRNTTIPVQKNQTFSTYSDGQTAIDVKIYQGERTLTKDCILLGNFKLDGIPPAPRGVPQIEIDINIDANSIMNVRAKDKGTNKENNITIKAENGRLTDEEIQQALDDAAKFEKADKLVRERIEAKNNLENQAYNYKNGLSREESKSKLNEEDLTAALAACNDVLTWLETATEASCEEYKSREIELNSIINPIMTKLYATPSTSADPTSAEADDANPTADPSPPPTADDLD